MNSKLVPAAAVPRLSSCHLGSRRRPEGVSEPRPGGVESLLRQTRAFIPMRDGVKLFTIVYAPRDTTVRYPFLMTRTAYGIAPYARTISRRPRPAGEFAKEGYIFVYQDARGSSVRGRVRAPRAVRQRLVRPNEATDTWDTIDWLVKNVPNNNGRVGQGHLVGRLECRRHDRRASRPKASSRRLRPRINSSATTTTRAAPTS